MSRNRFTVQGVYPSYDFLEEPIAPTMFHVELYRLDVDNLSTPLGKIWVEIDDVFLDHSSDSEEAVAEKLEELGYITRPKTQEDELAALKKDRWDTISAIRDALETRGFPYQGATFDSDERSVLRIILSSVSAQVAKSQGHDMNITWTLADNSTMDLTTDDLIAMPLALTQYMMGLHQYARTLRDQINTATTPAEVRQCVWEGYEDPVSEDQGDE